MKEIILCVLIIVTSLTVILLVAALSVKSNDSFGEKGPETKILVIAGLTTIVLVLGITIGSVL